jgi:hypothetical protein
MKKLLLILLMTNTSIFAGSLVVNDDDAEGSGIYEVSDDGSEYTLVKDIDFQFTQVATIVDNANGKVYFRRSTDPIADPDNPGNFISYQYYVMYDVATDTFTGEYGDDLFNGFEQLSYDVTFDELENGLVYSAISSASATATANTNNISSNSSTIATNAAGIATNKTNIATNTTNIATNAAGIATNKTNIATNTTNIATNAAGIAANKTNIATNTAGIANNVVRLDNLAALTASNSSRVEGLETLTGLMQNEYRSGIASSIALSQIQYAASGFSIGVGHGEFKNKDEMAVGIGYGGQFNEDVGFQFQFGTSGDSTGFGFTVNF